MKGLFSTTLVLLMAGVADLGATPAQEPPIAAKAAAAGVEDGEIRAESVAFVDAFRKGDARAIGGLFAEDGEAVDASGGSISGRPAIEDHYGSRFAESPGDKIEVTIDSVRILAPGVARENGQSRIIPASGDGAVAGKYSAIRIKRDGRWLIASVRELPEEEVKHHDRLAELGWMIGDWVEETGEAVVINSLVWSDDGNYILRTYDVRSAGKPAVSGTQRIGWDPLTKQIKSWIFDSRGGYGEGLWIRDGDRWTIKSTSVRTDGQVATATQVLTRVSKDRARWKSVDRTLGGESARDIEEFLMVRKPPDPR